MKETVDIHGKQYETVASRVQRLLSECVGYKITTEIISFDDDKAVVKAYILNDNNEVMATGHAFEKASGSFINKTSYLENAETSAVGRALAFCGFAGSEIATADEVANAINNQKPEQLKTDLRKDELIKLGNEVKDLLSKDEQDFLLQLGLDSYVLSDETYINGKTKLTKLKENK